MKRMTKVAIAAGTALVIGAAAIPALSHGADEDGRGGWFGRGHGGGMMQEREEGGYWQRGARGHGGEDGAARGMMGGGMMGGGMMEGGMMSPEVMRMMMGHGGGGLAGPGMAGPGGKMRGGGMLALLADGADADGNGVVSPEELRARLAAWLEEFDADGDGALSLAEFEALHAALIRPRMVDRFQALDEDGDGRVTASEMDAPARRMEQIMKLRERMRGWRHDRGPKADRPRGMMGGAMMDEGPEAGGN